MVEVLNQPRSIARVDGYGPQLKQGTISRFGRPQSLIGTFGIERIAGYQNVGIAGLVYVHVRRNAFWRFAEHRCKDVKLKCMPPVDEELVTTNAKRPSVKDAQCLGVSVKMGGDRLLVAMQDTQMAALPHDQPYPGHPTVSGVAEVRANNTEAGLVFAVRRAMRISMIRAKGLVAYRRQPRQADGCLLNSTNQPEYYEHEQNCTRIPPPI